MRSFRPNMLLSEATVGCSTVEASRKLVPDQNASRAVPPSAALMVGMATDSVVASKAQASPSTHRALKASMKSFVGLNTGLSWTISTVAVLVTVGILCRVSVVARGSSSHDAGVLVPWPATASILSLDAMFDVVQNT